MLYLVQEFGTVFLKVSDYSLNIYKFKVSLRQLLLRILELEDTYVATPTLVNKIKQDECIMGL